MVNTRHETLVLYQQTYQKIKIIKNQLYLIHNIVNGLEFSKITPDILHK